MAMQRKPVPTLQEMYELKNLYKNAINVVDNGIYVMFTYTYANRDLFTTPWGKEVRGITFHKKTGTVVSRPFHKFFNSSEPGAPKEFSPVTYAEKLDGSLLQVSWDTTEDRLFVASRSTLREDTSYVINAFKKLPQKTIDTITEFAEAFSQFTHLFELLDPNNQIVIAYPELSVSYLMSRSKLFGDYYYTPIPNIDAVNWLHTKGKSTDDFVRLAKTTEGMEGWVLFDTRLQDFVKIKTPWYLERHKVTELNLPEHYLNAWAEAILDDYLSFARLSNNNKKAKKIEKVLDLLDKCFEEFMESSEVLEAAKKRTLHPRKEAALALKAIGGPDEVKGVVFSAAMQTYGRPHEEFVQKLQELYKKEVTKSGKLREKLLKQVKDVIYV